MKIYLRMFPPWRVLDSPDKRGDLAQEKLRRISLWKKQYIAMDGWIPNLYQGFDFVIIINLDTGGGVPSFVVQVFHLFKWKYTSHATMIPGIQKYFPTMFSVNLGSSSFVRTSPARTFFKQICTNKPQKCASSKNLHIIDYHHLSSVDQSSQPWQDSGSLLKSSAFFQLPEIFHDNGCHNHEISFGDADEICGDNRRVYTAKGTVRSLL